MNSKKYFAVNEEIEELIRSIKKDIYLSMNGICATKLNESGIEYKQSFGVSWARICEIAQNYKPNYELAERLWLLPIRETKLIATLLCPPQDLNLNNIQDWIDGITNTELAEIFSFALLRKATHLTESIINMETYDDEFIRLTAYHTLSRQISVLSDDQIKRAIKNINIKDIEHISDFRAIESLLSNTICKTKTLNSDIKSLIEKIKKSDSLYSKQLIDNIEELL